MQCHQIYVTGVKFFFSLFSFFPRRGHVSSGSGAQAPKKVDFDIFNWNEQFQNT